MDKLPEKRQKALEMGADASFSPDTSELEGYLKQHNIIPDAVIDAVGREEIIIAALPMLELGGSICVYGVIDKPQVVLQKHLGPYKFNLFIHQWPTRVREAAAQEPLIQWIEQGKLSYKEFLSAEYPARDFAKGFEQSKTGLPVKTLYRFE
jgi:alcohol dehydrogenase